MENIYSYIIELLEKKGTIPGKNIQEKKEYNYIESGYIDSISIIQFIIQIESHFSINLFPEDTVSEKFKTIGGLIEIIQKKLD